MMTLMRSSKRSLQSTCEPRLAGASLRWILLLGLSVGLGAACFEGEKEPNTGRVDDTEADADADADADSDSDSDSDTDTAADPYSTVSIPQLQGAEVEPGSLVRIDGAVVVGPQLEEGFHVADPEGAITLGGLWLSGTAAQGEVAEGDLVRVTGRFVERADSVEAPSGDGTLSTLELDAALEPLGSAPTPAPVIVRPEDLADPVAAEAFEGMLLRVEDATVAAGGIGSWTLEGGLKVGSLYHSSSALSGATLQSVTGLLWYQLGQFVLCPRTQDDLVGYDARLDDCGEAACIGELSAGQLVITEVMRDPEAVYDDLGEWFELYNASEGAVDLRGLEVTDEDGDRFVVTESVRVEPGDYAVLAAEGDPELNGGAVVDWDYPYPSFGLSNGADELVLAHGKMIFDRVAWDDGVTFPDHAGASMALDPDHLDADGNDDGASWCASSAPYGDGDLGSPGSANSACVE